MSSLHLRELSLFGKHSIEQEFALAREIFFNTPREISYLRAAMLYPLFIS